MNALLEREVRVRDGEGKVSYAEAHEKLYRPLGFRLREALAAGEEPPFLPLLLPDLSCHQVFRLWRQLNANASASPLSPS